MIPTKFVSHFFLLPLLSFGTIILLLSTMFAYTIDTAAYAQQIAKPETSDNGSAAKTIPSSSLPSSPLPSSVHTKLHMIKITSPTKGQQIPAHSKFTITGTSAGNGTTSPDCRVSVIVNGIKPYQQVVPTGHGGPNDYSTWDYMLTPTYSAIKDGQNKITAKFFCTSNRSLTSHNSVNVTGVANNGTAIVAPVSSPRSTADLNNSSNNKSKLLSISLDLAKDPIRSGGNQTIKTTVLDASNSNATVAGASVKGTVTDSTNTTVTNFNGTTNKLGILSYSWKIGKGYKPGTFTVDVYGSANGYQNQITPTRMTFHVNSATVNKPSSAGDSNPTHHSVHRSTRSSTSSHSGQNHPSSIIKIPKIHFPHIRIPKIPFS
jgi:hypothetical protein